MTANQINYAKHLEETRHNKELEKLGARDSASRELTAQANWWQASTASKRQVEDARHNREQESTNWFSALETQRANQEKEAIQWWANRTTATETARHNQAMETQAQQQLQETRRANRASEANAQQSIAAQFWNFQRQHERGLATIDIDRSKAEAQLMSASAAKRQADVAYINATTRSQELAESIRHNVAAESELVRHNAMAEYLTSRQQTEVERHNEISEANARYANYVQAQNARTNQQNANTRAREADVSQQRADQDWQESKSKIWRNYVDAASAIIKNSAGLFVGGG